MNGNDIRSNRFYVQLGSPSDWTNDDGYYSLSSWTATWQDLRISWNGINVYSRDNEYLTGAFSKTMHFNVERRVVSTTFTDCGSDIISYNYNGN